MTTYTLPFALTTENENLLAFAGDWHGNWRWAVPCIEALGRQGVKSILHVGDFGIWDGRFGDEYLGKIRAALEKYDMYVYVTLGNHENYDLVDSFEKDDQGIAWFRHNIAVFPRVYGFEHQGFKFLSLGGAPSIDYQYRLLGRDWWAQEMISDEDVDLAIETARELGQVDIMITHDAPNGGTHAVQKILSNNPQGWSRKALNYAEEGRLRMNRAVYEIQPNLLVHGHYHVFDYGYLDYGEDRLPGQVISLNPDRMEHNLLIMDLEDIYDLQVSYGKQTIDFRKLMENE